MGESQQRVTRETVAVVEALGVETSGGRVHVRGEHDVATTPCGQRVFFVEFLTLTGVRDRGIARGPLRSRGPQRSTNRAMLGPWLLSGLSGHRRDAHSPTIRADGGSPDLGGMPQAVSEDTVRRALDAREDTAGADGMQAHREASGHPVLSAPWILDVEVTVTPLYGTQAGAESGDNPKKPGRPSPAYPTDQRAGLRLILGVDVEAGNESPSNRTLPGLLRGIDRRPAAQRPTRGRGDAGVGPAPVLAGLAARHIPYLFKLRLTKNVTREIQKVFWTDDWGDGGQGWEGRAGDLGRTGWTTSRRVVVRRRPLTGAVLLADESHQLGLACVESDGPAKRDAYAGRVTDLPHAVLTLAQRYRDRADSEHACDELKNPWGGGGCITQDITRCRLSARGVALAYTGWRLVVRRANPAARREAITSRPVLLAGVARKTRHAGQPYLPMVPMHGNGPQAMRLLTPGRHLRTAWKRIAERLPLKSVWQYVGERIATRVTGYNGPTSPNPLPYLCPESP